MKKLLIAIPLMLSVAFGGVVINESAMAHVVKVCKTKCQIIHGKKFCVKKCKLVNVSNQWNSGWKNNSGKYINVYDGNRSGKHINIYNGNPPTKHINVYVPLR